MVRQAHHERTALVTLNNEKTLGGAPLVGRAEYLVWPPEIGGRVEAHGSQELTIQAVRAEAFVGLGVEALSREGRGAAILDVGSLALPDHQRAQVAERAIGAE